jgi:ABC-2 type transport system permease protein
VRYSIAATIVIVVGLILGFDPGGGAPGIVLSLALILVFSFSLSWVWTVLALLMPTPESVMGVSILILFPLTFISNIFVDPQTMPSWLEAFVKVNPISHLATATRGLMHGTATAGEISLTLIACAALIAIFSPLTMYLYRNKNAR